jgi:nucleotide-binding universal stress UspA family protein
MKKIVVPVDFSEDSVRAFQMAVSIAQKVVAEISLLYIQREPALASFFSHSDKEIHDEEIEKNMQELMNRVPHAGVPVDSHIRKGRVFNEVVRFAEKENAYMIVIGTHGATGYEKSWMGSNAFKVVSSAECPVLTMRGDRNSLNIKKIVLPIDMTHTTRQKVPFTIELARFFNAKVYVLGVCTDEMEEFVTKITSYSAQVCRVLSKNGIDNEYEYAAGNNPTTLTIDYAKKIDADLICIMTDQENSLLSTLLGPHASQMVNQSPVPVLSMHKNADIEGDVSIM